MMKLDADEKPVSCEFIGCDGNVAPYIISSTTNIKSLEQESSEDCISRQAAIDAADDMVEPQESEDKKWEN